MSFDIIPLGPSFLRRVGSTPAVDPALVRRGVEVARAHVAARDARRADEAAAVRRMIERTNAIHEGREP